MDGQNFFENQSGSKPQWRIVQTDDTMTLQRYVLKWLGEMFGNKKCKVGIVCFLLISLIAVAVYGNDSICIFVYYDSVRVHTESTNVIFKFLCTVDDLALVQFICQM